MQTQTAGKGPGIFIILLAALLLIFSITITGLSAYALNSANASDAAAASEPIPMHALQVGVERARAEVFRKQAEISAQAEMERLKQLALAQEARRKEEQLRQEEEERKQQQALAAKYKAMTLEERLKDYLGSNVNKVGIAYYDLTTGKTLSINGNKTFIAASTVKVPLAMKVYDLVAGGQLQETQKIAYDIENHFEAGTGILQNQDLSQPLPLNLLVEYVIRYSDNIATNMLITQLGYNTFKQAVDEKAGIVTNHSGNYMTANGAMNILKRLYTESKGNSYYAKIIGWMKQTVFHDKLDRYLNHAMVAHKIGFYGAAVSDIGIIYTDKPYILAVYTNGVADPNTLIADISKIIYDRQVGNE